MPDGRLVGEWRVERVSGLLPPTGVGKRIGEERGVTTLLGLPVAPFVRTGDGLQYRVLPVRDLLSAMPDGTWAGEGRLLGVRFCRFRLVRRT
jgi:hypothetical protein